MEKVTVVKCGVCNSQFAKNKMGWHPGDAVPHCPECGEHDMIFFSHVSDVGVEGVDKND